MSTPVRTVAASLRVLLEHASTTPACFRRPRWTCPPASTTTRAISRIRRAGRWDALCFLCRGWMNFVSARESAAPGSWPLSPWHLSGIVSANTASSLVFDLAAADLFNRMACSARIESVEVRVSTLEEIKRVCEHRPPGTAVFFELAPEKAEELSAAGKPALAAGPSCAPAELRRRRFLPSRRLRLS